jgi:hypothetical protein
MAVDQTHGDSAAPAIKRDARGRRTRSHEEVLGIPRSGPLSAWRSAKELATTKAKTRAASWFLDSALVLWIINYLGHIFEGRAPFETYPVGETGVFTMPNDVTIGLAADWGTGTVTAYAVGDAIAAEHPDISIHLGDVYYSGDHDEFADYVLPKECWPRGSRPNGGRGEAAGTYFLNGNHEMYSGGRAFFDLALPELKQQTSYFCLQNDYWRVIGLDTGYDCTTGLQYILRIDHTTIREAVLDWLRTVVFRDPADRRPVILLSHHQWFTAFDDHEYPRVGQAMLPYLDRVVLWFWGHEHRFVGYAPFAPNGSPIHARCIGHGGMPVELFPTGDAHLDKNGQKTNWSRKPVFLDNRLVTTVNGTEIGHCGYAMVRMAAPAAGRGATVTIRYVDDRRTTLLEERWEQTAQGNRGRVTLSTDAPGFIWFRPPGDLVSG